MPYSNVELLLKLVAKLTRGERVEFYLRLKERYYGVNQFFVPNEYPLSNPQTTSQEPA